MTLLLQAKGLARAAQRHALEHAWADATAHPPHGHPPYGQPIAATPQARDPAPCAAHGPTVQRRTPGLERP